MAQSKELRVKTRSRREFKGKLRHFKDALTGQKQATTGPASFFWAAFAHSFFTQLHEAFLVKSDGGKDNLGKSWRPLKRSTIAARPVSGTSTKNSRGLLTNSENIVWKGIFASTLKKLLMRGMSEPEAKVLAAKLAWGILKKRGVRTKLEVLGNRKVPILIVSHELEESLQPGSLSGNSYQPPPSQVFEVENGTVNLGTSVEHAKYVHKKRPLWPARVTPWIANAVEAGTKHALNNFEQAIR